ncbi:MAG: Pyruvate/Phosphoenolpyruvate kinase domain protein [Gemmatimonadetes bacterium]|nr:Pyruvate/Phosphoenolpyruvate kinase domain protein [Gemmatimonadota bacterium]
MTSDTTRRTPGATALNQLLIADATADLREANLDFARRHPGDPAGRQPVHTVYGGAQLFGADAAAKIGGVAQRAMRDYAGTPSELGAALGIAEGASLDAVHARVAEKLAREAVEDFRIDFEDGYGNRADDEEDHHAVVVGEELARGMAEGTLPPFIGIRVKTLTEELRARSVRTLDIVVATVVRKAGRLPDNFVITIPKVTNAAQVIYTVAVLRQLERELGLADGALRFEVMVETPQIIIDHEGVSLLPRLVEIGEGRITGAHFGTYDYTASLNITAAHQRMRHPANDFAKHVMQVTLAATGVWLSDGSTAVLPVPTHRAPAGATLTEAQRRENRAAVHGAWKLHYDDVRHSLVGGFYQGWDLHPAQLVTRYAALYAFFLEGIDAAGARLRNFVDKAAQATLVGNVFDDAATGQGLLNFFLRGINSGAVTEAEALTMTGLTEEDFRGRSFVKIMGSR